MKTAFLPRIRFLSICILVFAALLVVRLYFVQIVKGDDYSARADHQYVRPQSALYDRGSIFFEDRDGRLVSAATLRSGYTLAIVPKEITDPDLVFEKLSAIIPLEKEAFLAHAFKKDDPYEEIAKRVDETAAGKITALDLSGVRLYQERWRYYPGGELGAQTVGFVGYGKNNDYGGRYGLERYYNDVLGKEGESLYVNFFAEVFADVNSAIFTNAEDTQGDVVTTIEPSVQLFLEKKLREVSERYNSKQTAGVIMNPKTGEIYALGVTPSFDLNAFQKEESPGVFVDPIVESVFEMGSIIKPLTMAAGIDSGAVTPQTTYYDAGKITLDTFTISNFDGKGRGTVDMQTVLSKSLNTGAAFVAHKMGHETFRKYMLAYGLGEETGIDLPNEAMGLVENLKSPREVEYATASFGQGIAMTPIETARALSVLANGGTLVTPHVVKKIRYDNGLSKTISYNDGKRILKPETSETITRMLVNVVDNALLNGTVKNPHYTVAAKTGTAQIPERGGYAKDKFLHSFFGYFPAYDPKFIVFLYTLEPKGVQYSSETLTKPFMETVDFLTNYYNIPPDR